MRTLKLREVDEFPSGKHSEEPEFKSKSFWTPEVFTKIYQVSHASSVWWSFLFSHCYGLHYSSGKIHGVNTLGQIVFSKDGSLSYLSCHICLLHRDLILFSFDGGICVPSTEPLHPGGPSVSFTQSESMTEVMLCYFHSYIIKCCVLTTSEDPPARYSNPKPTTTTRLEGEATLRLL